MEKFAAGLIVLSRMQNGELPTLFWLDWHEWALFQKMLDFISHTWAELGTVNG